MIFSFYHYDNYHYSHNSKDHLCYMPHLYYIIEKYIYIYIRRQSQLRLDRRLGGRGVGHHRCYHFILSFLSLYLSLCSCSVFTLFSLGFHIVLTLFPLCSDSALALFSTCSDLIFSFCVALFALSSLHSLSVFFLCSFRSSSILMIHPREKGNLQGKEKGRALVPKREKGTAPKPTLEPRSH